MDMEHIKFTGANISAYCGSEAHLAKLVFYRCTNCTKPSLRRSQYEQYILCFKYAFKNDNYTRSSTNYYW